MATSIADLAQERETALAILAEIQEAKRSGQIEPRRAEQWAARFRTMLNDVERTIEVRRVERALALAGLSDAS